MRRAIEWALAAIGAAVTVGVAVAFSRTVDPAASAVLAGVGLTGLAGSVAVALDQRGRHTPWGTITWLVAGVLSALVVLAGFSYGSFLIPAVVAFLGAALLAAGRQERSLLVYLGVYVGGALGCTFVIVMANVLDLV